MEHETYEIVENIAFILPAMKEIKLTFNLDQLSNSCNLL